MIPIASAPPSFGIGAGSRLVEQHERRRRERLVHRRRCWRCAPRRCSGSAAIDCSSPMSANTLCSTGTWRALGRRNQQPRLRHHRQQARCLQRDRLATRVRPRDHQHARRRNQQRCPPASRRSAATAISSGWRAPRSSSRPSAAMRRQHRRRRTPNTAPSPARRRASSPHRSSAGAPRPRRRNASDSAEQNAAHLLRFLLLERDDVVVDLDGAERLEEQARAAPRAAVHDAGNRGAVFRRARPARSGRCDP